MRCWDCGKEFMFGNRPDGLPNGVGFQMDDGTIVNVCSDCIIKEGEKRFEENRAHILFSIGFDHPLGNREHLEVVDDEQ